MQCTKKLELYKTGRIAQNTDFKGHYMPFHIKRGDEQKGYDENSGFR